jgi:DNA invertase Pin-like site-specific DNA recombinase
MITIPEFTGNLYGYARVSTEEQNLDLQMDALRAAGIPDNRIFTEKLSGKTTKRPKLELVRKVMRAGDGLVVWRMDRIGRNTIEVIQFIDALAKDQILFRSLSEQIDLTSPMGRFMVTIFAGLAQWERDMIAARTSAGMAAARARGVRMGPKHLILDCPKRFAKFIELWKSGDIPDGTLSAREIAATLNAVEGSKLPKMKSHTSYANWKARGFNGFNKETMERV